MRRFPESVDKEFQRIQEELESLYGKLFALYIIYSIPISIICSIFIIYKLKKKGSFDLSDLSELGNNKLFKFFIRPITIIIKEINKY